MKTIRLSTFEDFEQQSTALLERWQQDSKKRTGHFSQPIFRGQRKALWKLETTLERYTDKEYSERQYYNLMSRVRRIIQSCTGRLWNLPEKYTPRDDPGPSQEYEFMAYLRHYGFPCPLLDWTRSFYVAAFFAFRHRIACSGQEADAAIFAFQEYCGGGKGGWEGEAEIDGWGPYIATDKRHFIQQCEYTVCRKKSGDERVYCSHEDAFARKEEDQDVLRKFIIPKTEQRKVLARLRSMNITEYSLFGNEEGLLSDLAYNEIDKA